MKLIPLNTLRPVTEWSLTGEGFDFSQRHPNNPFKRWLGNACTWTLKKLGWLTPKREQFTTVTTVSFEPEHVFEFLHREIHEMSRRYNLDKGVVVMGAKQFNEVAKCALSSPLGYRMQVRDAGAKIIGMSVIVLPWVDGVVILPETMLPLKEVVQWKSLSDYSYMDLLKDIERRDDEDGARQWNAVMGREPES